MDKKKLIIIVTSVIVLLGGSIAGIHFGGIYDLGTLFEEKEEPIVMNKEASFFPLKEFVISLEQPGDARFVMVEMSLMSYDPRMDDQVEELDSVIRNTMLQYFSGKAQSEVRSELSDISKLQVSLKDALMEASKKYNQLLPLEKVLLTNIIIQ